MEQLKLPPRVLAVLNRHDEEDDFIGVDEGSRDEIADVTWQILHAIRNLSCLVILHNGTDDMVDLAKFCFPPFDWFSTNNCCGHSEESLGLTQE